MIQWHPLFAEILRPYVEGYFDVTTNMPVGDLPREVDIALVRRVASAPPPFQGVWRHLTTWNVLELKGPLEPERIRHLDLLVELGLGIDRRLNVKRVAEGKRSIAPDHVSFWYLANQIRQRFLTGAASYLGKLDTVGPGIWRATVMRRPVFLVSRVGLEVEPDAIPLHLVAREPRATEIEVAQLLLARDDLWARFGRWFSTLHKDAWKEFSAMATTKRKKDLEFSIVPAVDWIGIEEMTRQIGLKRIIDEIGVKRVIDEIGWNRVMQEGSIEDLVAQLTPELRQELKKRLK